MATPSLNPPIEDNVPWSDAVTDYDKSHLVVYLRLLDASAEGASIDEMASIILGIDPREEPQRAERAVASHLNRVQWMIDKGYRHLLISD